MAKVYPAIFDTDVKSSAERRLYEALVRELGDDWIVLHHVKWIGTDDRGYRCDGETDFIVAHPQFGILIIEVKGGLIRFDATTGHFISTDFERKDHDIGDPFEQAMKSKKNLIEKLRGMRGWPRERVLFGHVVAFTDAVTQATWLRPNAPREIIIDAIDLVSLEQKLHNAYHFWNTPPRITGRSDIPPSNTGIKVMIDTLYQSGSIRNPLLAESVRYDEPAFIQLTGKQLGYLRFIRGHRRAAIGGCAGSGKTFLAVEEARQLAEEEQKRVRFTCYNQGLAYHIGEVLGYHKLFDVFDFHQLCVHLGQEAGKRTAYQNDNSPDYFNIILPALLTEAIDVLGPRYDAMIVDEGQDFRSEWWEILPWLLHDPTNGCFYVFFDDNQRVYHDRSPIPIAQEPYHLDGNCRNTQRIAGVVNQFYTSVQPPKALGPEGLPIEIILYTDSRDGKDKIRRLLHRLIADAGFTYDQIAILSARGTQASDILGQRIGNIQLTDHLPLGSNEVFATTIRRFKGLERDVIVLCEIDGRMSLEDVDVLMYVGTSRAKHYLIVLQGQDAPSTVQQVLRQYYR